MPRFMVEINRQAFDRLQVEASNDRRTPQDQAGILLEQMLEAGADVAALADLEPNPIEPKTDPVAATVADPTGDAHKPR